MYINKGDYEKALVEIEKAINFDISEVTNYDKGMTNGIMLLRNRMKVLVKLGRNEEVIKETEEMERRIKNAYKGSAGYWLDMIYMVRAEALLNLKKEK